MMLLNDLYTCSAIQSFAGSMACTIIFNQQHDIFKGHFPGQSVVPGVCMMEIVKELLQQQTGKALRLTNAGNVKFLQLITPDIHPQVTINWKQNGQGSLQVDAGFKQDNNWLFKIGGNYSVLNS